MSRRKSKNRPKPRRLPAGGNTSLATGSPAAARKLPGGLARQDRARRPRPLPDEPLADIAVFEPARRAELPEDQARQAAAVAEALERLTDRRDGEALRLVADIPRGSPFSEWRLFLRGLLDWYAGKLDDADRCWQRLDAARRPARIAQVLRLAEDPSALNQLPADDRRRQSAALVREIRFERPALAEAERRLLRSPETASGKVTSEMVSWLLGLRADYRATEPQLIRSLETALLERAFPQPDIDVFERAAKSISGPPHDPVHRLLRSRYADSFREGKADARKLLKSYLSQDLPNCSGLREPVRQAIASLLYLELARDEINKFPADPMLARMMRVMQGMRASSADRQLIQASYREAVRAYPAHRAAQREYTAWLQEALESDDLSEAQEKHLLQELCEAMVGWSKALPEDVEPRLWLVDNLLESELIDQAQPHIDFLQQARLEDPLVRSLPWRCALLEAMRHARRKARLADAARCLDHAERLWPDWLSRDWLPFLRAALALRGGDLERFAQLRDQAASACAGPAVAEVMMFGAAQRMRVPAPDLRPLREAVNARAGKPGQLLYDELLSLGGFFWDLIRGRLLYPGYRNHGSKFGRELLRRLSGKRGKAPDDPRLEPAMLWASEFHFWTEGSQFSTPEMLRRGRETHPLFAAAVLRAWLKLGWALGAPDGYQRALALLISAAESEADPFYRHFLRSLADECQEKIVPTLPEPAGWPGRAPPWSSFAIDPEEDLDESLLDDDEWYDDEDDEPWFDGSYDPDCDCPNCCSNRAAARRAYRVELDDRKAAADLDEADVEDDEVEDDEGAPFDAMDDAWRQMGGPVAAPVDAPPTSPAANEDWRTRRKRNPLDPRNKQKNKKRR